MLPKIEYPVFKIFIPITKKESIKCEFFNGYVLLTIDKRSEEENKFTLHFE